MHSWWYERRKWLGAAALLALVCVPALRAQRIEQDAPAVFDIERHPQPVASLDGLWRFQAGDDADGTKGWARPGFDDSGWTLIRGGASWSEQGYHNYGGVGWYRARVMTGGTQPLSIYLPQVGTNYQLFADGQLIGGLGGLPPQPTTLYQAVPLVFALPQPADGKGLTLAVRVYQPPHWAQAYGGGLLGGLLIGRSNLIDHRMTLDVQSQAWNQVDGIFLAIFETLAGLAALGLFALRTQEREYLWFGVWLILSAAIRSLFIYTAFHPIGRMEHDMLWQGLYRCATLAEMAFYYRFLKGERGVLFWLAIASVPVSVALMAFGLAGWISVALWIELGIAMTLPMVVWTVELLIRRAIQGLPDARLLCIPVLLQELVAFVGRTLNLGYRTGWYNLPGEWIYATSTWPFPFTLQDVADALFLVGMLAILIQRFSRTSRHEDDLQREREAAKSVQQLLITESIVNHSGLVIHSVYRPAGQVGGDFFQILPLERGDAAGSVLIAIGDVSGKGLPAAMTVSMLVGTLGALAQYVHRPGELLATLNERVLARSLGGFTTCMILRAEPSGRLTLASAGHPAPYLDGIEVPLENGLPLGLVGSAVYPEVTVTVRIGQQLTLLTDGVVEARGKSGELMGFDRTAELSRQSAGAIALAAQDFGQDDDITVLTVVRHQLR